MITYNFDDVMPTFCDKTQFWCHKTDYGLQSNDPGFLTLNNTEYKYCLRYCQQNTACKTFEYMTNRKVCRFSSRLAQNVEEQAGASPEVFWKKGASISCAHEMDESKADH